MRLFSQLYQRVLRWSAHQHAPLYLAGVSFAESSFFPIPPDLMLISMSLATPSRALAFAFLTTVCSVVGGMVGYGLGFFFAQWVEPYLTHLGYAHTFSVVKHWFTSYGVWVVFIAGFSPIPYKVFTVTAGVMQMAFLPFVLASIIGRGLRFFLVASAISYFGPRIEPYLQRYIEVLGWLCVLVFIILVVYFKMR